MATIPPAYLERDSEGDDWKLHCRWTEYLESCRIGRNRILLYKNRGEVNFETFEFAMFNR